MPSFSAVLLAGGKSKRMGRDKALLPMPDSKLLLWQWQLRTLEALRPGQIFWSGLTRPDLPAHIEIVPDEITNAGPLAGISACLDLLTRDLLLVLAIDLPGMTSVFLKTLLARCSAECGAVVRHGDFFEPLAAIYPKGLRARAAQNLKEGRYALQDLVRDGIQLGLLQPYPLEEKDAALFKNLNSPADLA